MGGLTRRVSIKRIRNHVTNFVNGQLFYLLKRSWLVIEDEVRGFVEILNAQLPFFKIDTITRTHLTEILERVWIKLGYPIWGFQGI